MINTISRLGAIALLAMAWALPAAAAEALRAAVLQSGTVNWELDTIKHYGLDTANGFDLQITGTAGNPASQIAFPAKQSVADLMAECGLVGVHGPTR